MAIKPELDALILATLQDGPKHGYDILKSIRRSSPGLFKDGEGRHYSSLHGLEEDGIITANWIDQEDRPPIKVYSLSRADDGKKVKRRTPVWGLRNAMRLVA